jgi:hypothetical protein
MLAALLALSVLLNLMVLIVGVATTVTGKSHFPPAIERLRRRRTPASTEDERLQGMSSTLGATAGLLLSIQIGFVIAFTSAGWPGPRTFPAVLVTLLGVTVVFFVVALLSFASAMIAFRVRYVDLRPPTASNFE